MDCGYNMTPLAYCQEKVKQSGSSFVGSFRFLPKDKRAALTCLYAFCREVDDIVDDCSDMNVAQQTLIWWRQDLSKAFRDEVTPEHPVCQALKIYAPQYQLPEKEFVEIIDGMQMDLEQNRYARFVDLSQYCYRVAGVVGRLTARILGISDLQTLAYAEKLGLALQLTNIIRDVGEDARNNRIYLAQDELALYSVDEQSVLAAEITPEFTEFMQFQINRAKKTYQEALALLPACDRKNQQVGLIMAAIYYQLLKEVEADGAGNVLDHKIILPSGRKFRIAIKTWLLGFKL